MYADTILGSPLGELLLHVRHGRDGPVLLDVTHDGFDDRGVLQLAIVHVHTHGVLLDGDGPFQALCERDQHIEMFIPPR